MAKSMGFHSNQVITFNGPDKQKYKCKLGLNIDVPKWVFETDHFKLASKGLNPMVKAYEQLANVKDVEFEKNQKELAEAKKKAADESAKALEAIAKNEALEKELAELKENAEKSKTVSEKDKEAVK